MSDRVLQSDYMHFAKFGADARYNLATSGVADCDLADLGLTMDDLALHGVNAGGYAPLMEKVARAVRRRSGLRGDAGRRLLVRQPPGAGGAGLAGRRGAGRVADLRAADLAARATCRRDVRRFERRPDEAWRLDPDRVAAAITPATTRRRADQPAQSDRRARRTTRRSRAVAAAADRGRRDGVRRRGLPRADVRGRPRGDLVPRGRQHRRHLQPHQGVRRQRPALRLDPGAGGAGRSGCAASTTSTASTRRTSPSGWRGRLRAAAAAAGPRHRHRSTPTAPPTAQLLGGHPRLEQIVFDHGATVFPRLAGERRRRLLPPADEPSTRPASCPDVSSACRTTSASASAGDPHAPASAWPGGGGAGNASIPSRAAGEAGARRSPHGSIACSG